MPSQPSSHCPTSHLPGTFQVPGLSELSNGERPPVRAAGSSSCPSQRLLKGAGQQKCRRHPRAGRLLSISARPGLGPPGPPFTLTTSLCYRKPWEQVPKKPKRKKSKWSPAWGGVGACRARPGIGQSPSLSLCYTVRRETEGDVSPYPACLRQYVMNLKQPPLTMTSVPCQILGFWVSIMPVRVVQQRTSWWQ